MDGCVLWVYDSDLKPSARAPECDGRKGCCWLIATAFAPSDIPCGGVGQPGCVSWSGLSGRASVKLRSAFADSMVLQHSIATRIVGDIDGLAGAAAAGAEVTVRLDGATVGSGVTQTDGAFDVEIAAHEISAIPHTLDVSIVVPGTLVKPATLTGVLFGEQHLCVGQSNAEMPVWFANNGTAEIDAADWPLIRIAQVQRAWEATAPQVDAAFSIPWGPVDHGNIAGFSALCYYTGRAIFEALGGKTPVGLIEVDQGGTYIQSFMPATAMLSCNTTGKRPTNWAARTGTQNQTLNPWGGQNLPAALWNTMLSPLLALNIKMVIYDQAEHNLATGESEQYRCLQDQLVSAYRKAWGENLTVHVVQLPSFNMTEFAYTFVDSLGEMRLSQSLAVEDTPRTTAAVTIDLADLHSPWGSVHNRQKQEVGRRVALLALATGYGKPVPLIEAGLPVLHGVVCVGDGIVIRVASRGGGAQDVGGFAGSNDCIRCCNHSAFEVTVDGKRWARVRPQTPRLDPTNSSIVEIALSGVAAGVTSVRYAFDDLVQCPYFSVGGLPLGRFRKALESQCTST
eukprot:SAG11_NODE_1644_length_4526_cov_1.563813_4_plen_567_part_00